MHNDFNFPKSGIKIRISGIVQGVGFRPFLHRTITDYSLYGWVRNTFDGVELHLEGKCADIEAFSAFLQDPGTSWPPMAKISGIHIEKLEEKELQNFHSFEIIASESEQDEHMKRRALISPDICVCEDCVRELFDKNDRRYHYPFINCTNCGPRFTILRDVPYDRKKTSMEAFEMCPECAAEYTDIWNRRYHAQPDCCADCGPRLFFAKSADLKRDGINWSKTQDTDTVIEASISVLLNDGILALKGLGGYHLCCRTDHRSVIEKLRQRKQRDDKPFAVMCADLETARLLAKISAEEAKLLMSPERPIVLLEKRDSLSKDIQASLAAISDNQRIGIMLPYTPLHYLLLEEKIKALVMTSANLSDRPIVSSEKEAIEELSNIADAFLMHNREIITKCDDSVCWAEEGHAYFARRSRGYVPAPIDIERTGLTSADNLSEGSVPSVLACGAELKASFAMNRGKYVFLSQHIGDLKNIETLDFYESQIRHFKNLFDISPNIAACDMHPDYLSSAFASECGTSVFRVQHHHAHMASCMADNGIRKEQKCLGIIWDGTGLGTDGKIWGSEFLLGDYRKAERVASIRPIKLPGGDKCMKDIWRTALSIQKELEPAKQETKLLLQDRYREEAELVKRQLEAGINCPESSGMGRLFDSAAAILGIREQNGYEGQAAVLLESLAEKCEETCVEAFSYGIYKEEDGVLRLDWRPLFREMLEAAGFSHNTQENAKLAKRFMYTLCHYAASVCEKAGIPKEIPVVLSGGSFQNLYLLKTLKAMLQEKGYSVYTHRQVSTNDEGLALGQLAVSLANQKLSED